MLTRSLAPQGGGLVVGPFRTSCFCLFIEKAGLKGYSIDGVGVSEKHANFFVAKRGTKAQSLFELVKYVKAEVFNKFDISLEEEIIFAGNFY